MKKKHTLGCKIRWCLWWAGWWLWLGGCQGGENPHLLTQAQVKSDMARYRQESEAMKQRHDRFEEVRARVTDSLRQYTLPVDSLGQARFDTVYNRYFETLISLHRAAIYEWNYHLFDSEQWWVYIQRERFLGRERVAQWEERKAFFAQILRQEQLVLDSLEAWPRRVLGVLRQPPPQPVRVRRPPPRVQPAPSDTGG